MTVNEQLQELLARRQSISDQLNQTPESGFDRFVKGLAAGFLRTNHLGPVIGGALSAIQSPRDRLFDQLRSINEAIQTAGAVQNILHTAASTDATTTSTEQSRELFPSRKIVSDASASVAAPLAQLQLEGAQLDNEGKRASNRLSQQRYDFMQQSNPVQLSTLGEELKRLRQVTAQGDVAARYAERNAAAESDYLRTRADAAADDLNAARQYNDLARVLELRDKLRAGGGDYGVSMRDGRFSVAPLTVAPSEDPLAQVLAAKLAGLNSGGSKPPSPSAAQPKPVSASAPTATAGKSVAQLRAEAMAAIQRGASVDQVRARFKAMTGEDL